MKAELKNNHKIFIKLRNTYKYFIFESFLTRVKEDQIEITFHFNLADKHHFYPNLSIPKKYLIQNMESEESLDSLVFHIGLIELISYWKCACPPKLIIRPACLTQEQVNWWKKLYYFGLGEFFYMNGISASQEDFIEIINDSEKVYDLISLKTIENKVLVPVGGGKDSAVTLELLKKNFKLVPFIVNSRQASRQTVINAGFSENDIFLVNRIIDPLLLKLNDEGYLNGHTPFSALLAFVSLYASAVSGCRHIALSNESSANEPTTSEGVNHQYSKTVEFEKDFRKYVSAHITRDLNYFSFLRPLDEFAIARIFSEYPNHFFSFRSCNAGSKTDEWCGECPKCLFTFIILSPFIHRQTMIKIFGKDLFENSGLLKIFKELTGMSNVKPFECVGTVDEINLALHKIIERYPDELPALLGFYVENRAFNEYQRSKFMATGKGNFSEHFLEPAFLRMLKTNTNA